jgi:ATP-dependent DNA ligase
MIAELRHLPDGLFDGEYVTPGGKSWNAMRLDTPKVLVLFDVLEIFGQSVTAQPYGERRKLLVQAALHVPAPATAVTVTMPEPVTMAAVHAIWARGGEGAILKRAASTYQPNRRSDDWIKVKQKDHETLTIVGFAKGKGKNSTPYSVTLLRADDGREARVKTVNAATVRAIAANPAAWVGRRLVIHYAGLTDTRSFRSAMWDHLAGDGE